MIALLRGLYAAAPQRTLAALALSIAVGLTEGLTLLLLLPLLQLAGVAVEGTAGQLAAKLGSVFAAFGIAPTLIAVLAVYVVLSVIQASLARARLLADAKAVQRYTLSLRERLYSAISRAQWLTISRMRSSDFTYALTTAVDQVDNGANNVLFLAATSVVVIVYSALALRLSPTLTAIVIGTSGILLLVERARTLLGRKRGEQVTSVTTEVFATAAEQLGGLKTAKSYGNEERHLSLFLELGRKLNSSRLALTRAFAGLRWQMTVGSVIALSLILYLAVGVFRLPTASILLLLFIFSRLVPRMVTLQQTMQEVLSTVPALETIETLIERCESAPERGAVSQGEISLAKQIEAHDITFSYEEAGSAQLSNLSLTIPAGKTTAIVGASGAGKSTLADLLLGLLKPRSGAILVDGVPLDETRLASWRSQIGYVAQDTFLFNDTVRFNLDWAVPGASEEDMLRALDDASASEIVAQLPSGLDTVIGERGVRLSGGEKQRLSLARALLRNPRVLVLDEATSALDSENEERIFSAIQRLHGEMTIVIITHRLSTIRNADVVHVLDEGSLVSSGTWDDLLASPQPRFRELARAQGLAVMPASPDVMAF